MPTQLKRTIGILASAAVSLLLAYADKLPPVYQKAVPIVAGAAVAVLSVWNLYVNPNGESAEKPYSPKEKE